VLTNVISIVSVGIWIVAAYTTFFTPSGSGWRMGLDVLALMLLIVVMVLTTGPWEDFKLPTFAPRRVRLALYWTVLIASIAADTEWSWTQHPDGARCHSSTTMFLSAFFVSPLLAAEAQAQRQERDARA
jgi:hypothetical protein